jgi:hypothetical protein
MSLGLARQGLQAGPYRLAPLAESDIRDLLALFADPAVVEFMDIDPLESLAEARDIVAWARELALRERGLRWSIRRAGQVVGDLAAPPALHLQQVEADCPDQGRLARPADRPAQAALAQRQLPRPGDDITGLGQALQRVDVHELHHRRITEQRQQVADVALGQGRQPVRPGLQALSGETQAHGAINSPMAMSASTPPSGSRTRPGNRPSILNPSRS